MSLNLKLLKIQEEIGAIKKDATNPFFNSKYFDINSLLAQIKPILNKHGIVLMQPLCNLGGYNLAPLRAALRTELLDTDSGQSISDMTLLPEINDPQKMGSAITYYRRYALQSLLGLEAEDDDANMASAKVAKPVAKKKEINTDEPPFEDGPADKSFNI